MSAPQLSPQGRDKFLWQIAAFKAAHLCDFFLVETPLDSLPSAIFPLSTARLTSRAEPGGGKGFCSSDGSLRMYHIAPICLFRAPSHVLIEFIPITIPACAAGLCLLNLFACYFTRSLRLAALAVRLTPFEQSTLARVKI